jgi:hypothetical protein
MDGNVGEAPMRPGKLFAICGVVGAVGILLGVIWTNAYHALRNPAHGATTNPPARDYRAPRPAAEDIEKIVVRANLANVEGGRIAEEPRETIDRTIFHQMWDEPWGFRESFDRGGKSERGYVRHLLTTFDWTNVKVDPAAGGVPAKDDGTGAAAREDTRRS